MGQINPSFICFFPGDIHWPHCDCLGALHGSLVENYLCHKPNNGGIVVFDLASSQVWRDLLAEGGDGRVWERSLSGSGPAFTSRVAEGLQLDADRIELVEQRQQTIEDLDAKEDGAPLRGSRIASSSISNRAV